MNDLIETLRAVANGGDYDTNVNHLCDQAADELEQAQKALQDIADSELSSGGQLRQVARKALATDGRKP